MNGVAWINLACVVFNAVKIWVDPEYEKVRDLIIQGLPAQRSPTLSGRLLRCFTTKESAGQKALQDCSLYVAGFHCDLHGLGRSPMSKRVFVCVSGGVVHKVIVPPETNGTWTVIDWDNIESDPAREWGQLDEEDRAYVKANYPDDYAKYFAPFEGK